MSYELLRILFIEIRITSLKGRANVEKEIIYLNPAADTSGKTSDISIANSPLRCKARRWDWIAQCRPLGELLPTLIEGDELLVSLVNLSASQLVS